MNDPTYYTNLLSKRRERDLTIKGSLTRVKMTERQTIESLFPFYDSIPSPVEYEAVLARTTPNVLADDLIIEVGPIPMEIEVGPIEATHDGACAIDRVDEENVAVE